MTSQAIARTDRSTPMTWAIGFVLVALCCLISFRPALALTHASCGQDADTYQTSPFERSFSSQLLPASAQATEPRRSEKRLPTETPLVPPSTQTGPEAPRSRTCEPDLPRPLSVFGRIRRARGPPA